MTTKLKSSKLNILSPWTLGMFLGAVSVMFFLIPNSFYMRYIHERGNLYLNYVAMLYILACTIFFCISSYAAYVVTNNTLNKHKISNSKLGLDLIQISTFILLTVNLAYVIYAVGLRTIVSVYFGGNTYSGNTVKLQLSQAISNGKLGWITDLGMAFLVWSFWCILCKPKSHKILIFLLNVALYFMNSFIAFSRDSMVSLIIMLVSIYILHAYTTGKINIGKVISASIILVISFIGVFAVIGLARSSNFQSATYEVVKQFMGYFPASYNRLAYVIEGKLVYPNSGWGFYSTQFLWDAPLISGSLGIYRFGSEIGIPLPTSAEDNWLKQFSAVQASGLDSSYIWSTIFGFLYSDFGFFAVIYFVVYGFIAGLTYWFFSRGDNFGILLYPFIISTIIKWPSVVSFSQRGIIIFIVAWLIIVMTNNALRRGTNGHRI